MTEKVEQVRTVDGVQYVTTYAGSYRVVFTHNANSQAVRDVEAIFGCRGKMGATQEHLPAIDYDVTEVQA